MEFYTLGEELERRDTIDEFISGIWTERYSDPGDATLVVPYTKDRVAQLTKGTLLTISDSPEVVLIDTTEIAEGLLTVKGKTIDGFFDNLVFRTTISGKASGEKFSGTPGQIMGKVLRKTIIWEQNATPTFFTVGVMDTEGTIGRILVPYGSAGKALAEIAKKHNIGQTVERVGDDDSGHQLVYLTYSGKDRTRNQEEVTPIRFAKDLDNFANVKELSSNATAATVCRVYAPDSMLVFGARYHVTSYSPKGSDGGHGFNRRCMEIIASDITEEMITDDVSLDDLLKLRGEQALLGAQPTRVIDGEVVPETHVYKKHYFLGDTVETEGYSGHVENRTVSEYIRTSDETGPHAYPTLSVPASVEGRDNPATGG